MAFSSLATVALPRAIESDPLALALKLMAVALVPVASVLFVPPLDPPPRATAFAPVALAERPKATAPTPLALAPAPTAVAGFSGFAPGAWAELA